MHIKSKYIHKRPINIVNFFFLGNCELKAITFISYAYFVLLDSSILCFLFPLIKLHELYYGAWLETLDSEIKTVR